MSSQTSLTGVAVSSGYVSLLHVSDTGGLHATTARQIYDGDGTASCLFLATEVAKFTLGTDSGDDFSIGAAATILQIEGDQVNCLLILDGTTASDFQISDGTDVMLLIESDVDRFTFTGKAGAGSDFIIADGTVDRFTYETDTNALTINFDGTAGSDLQISGATEVLFLLESDDGTLEINLDVSIDDAQSLTMGVASNIVLDTATGTKIGTAASQKLGFFNAAPVVQQTKAGHGDWGAISNAISAMVELGLVDAV